MWQLKNIYVLAQKSIKEKYQIHINKIKNFLLKIFIDRRKKIAVTELKYLIATFF